MKTRKFNNIESHFSEAQSRTTTTKMPRAGRTVMSAIMLLALMLTALPYSTLRAEETTDSTTTATKTKSKRANIQVSGLTINGRPATSKEKKVVKEMTKQGARMATKGIQLASTAITDPARAEQLGSELEEMGNEMERMGDSLEAMADDTVFIYNGDEDGDSLLLSESDIDEMSDDAESTLRNYIENTWWGKLFGGTLGFFGIMLVILFTFIILAVVFLLITAPVWVLALIIWLLVRNDRKKAPRTQTQAYASTGATAGNNGTQAPQTNGTNSGTEAPSAMRVSPVEAENSEMWRSGINMCCLGVGLAVFFMAIGWDGWWGIGALVACIGIAKVIIAYSAKKKQDPNQNYGNSYNQSASDTVTASDSNNGTTDEKPYDKTTDQAVYDK